jgi:hypothetical protein
MPINNIVDNRAGNPLDGVQISLPSLPPRTSQRSYRETQERIRIARNQINWKLRQIGFWNGDFLEGDNGRDSKNQDFSRNDLNGTGTFLRNQGAFEYELGWPNNRQGPLTNPGGNIGLGLFEFMRAVGKPKPSDKDVEYRPNTRGKTQLKDSRFQTAAGIFGGDNGVRAPQFRLRFCSRGGYLAYLGANKPTPTDTRYIPAWGWWTGLNQPTKKNKFDLGVNPDGKNNNPTPAYDKPNGFGAVLIFYWENQGDQLISTFDYLDGRYSSGGGSDKGPKKYLRLSHPKGNFNLYQEAKYHQTWLPRTDVRGFIEDYTTPTRKGKILEKVLSRQTGLNQYYTTSGSNQYVQGLAGRDNAYQKRFRTFPPGSLNNNDVLYPFDSRQQSIFDLCRSLYQEFEYQFGPIAVQQFQSISPNSPNPSDRNPYTKLWDGQNVDLVCLAKEIVLGQWFWRPDPSSPSQRLYTIPSIKNEDFLVRRGNQGTVAFNQDNRRINFTNL